MKFLHIISLGIITFLVNITSASAYFSVHTTLLEGVIPEGRIVSSSKEDSWILKSDIRDQLSFSVGQLNGIGGSPNINSLKIEITGLTELGNEMRLYTYSAKLDVAWPIEIEIPSTYALKVPTRLTHTDLETFFNAFVTGPEDKRCVDVKSVEHVELSGVNLWYFYRPDQVDCPLSSFKGIDENIAFKLNLNLKKSHKNSTNKFPEYQKVWEDGKLVITTIFGLYKKDAKKDDDLGAQGYMSTINAVLKKFGKPKYSNVKLSFFNRFKSPMANRYVHFVFATKKGDVDIAFYLVERIRPFPRSILKSYVERSRKSDFISFSGHSGMGKNIESLARNTYFEKGQYRIFLINGCSSYAYLDPSIDIAGHEANPDSRKNQHVDIISNAMISYYEMNGRSNMAIINALYKERKSYYDILGAFDINQRAVVTGEEDNLWPFKF